MIDQQILAYGTKKAFHQKTLDRWLKLAENDRGALLALAEGLKMGENHLRDFLDWLEEISLRDGVSIRDILTGESFERISSNPRLGRGDKLKRIKEEVRRLRYPRLRQIEGEIGKRIRELKLIPQIQMSVPPGLEGGALNVRLRATSFEELGQLVDAMGQALERKAMKEIFALLGGNENVGL